MHGEPQMPPLKQVASLLHSRLDAFLSESHEEGSLLQRVQAQTRISMRVIQEALQRHPYEELSLSYNGGKDCLVMVVLFLACLHCTGIRVDHDDNKAKNGSTPSSGEESHDTVQAAAATHDKENQQMQTHTLPQEIPAIYAQPECPFPSVESFIHSSAQTYHLSIQTYPTNPPKSSLKSVFASYLDANPSIRAIFVGTRRTDPFGADLTHFARTDHGWPDFIRIHPVIDWRYAEIWAFIRHLGIDYCDLYDQGYTSLGGMNNTHPNPKLKRTDEEAKQFDGEYKPAYELVSDDEERLGRA